MRTARDAHLCLLEVIRLNRKEGRRVARVGSMNIAGAKMGVMDKDRVPFEQRLVRAGLQGQGELAAASR